MKYDRVVVAYHGCERAVAERILDGRTTLQPSVNDYDWLGTGIYFWEYGPERALHFAREKLRRDGQLRRRATVVGALIQLGRCFDLLDTRFTEDVAAAYPLFRSHLRSLGVPMPENGGPTPDRLLRRRDCAFLNWYFEWMARRGTDYDVVRCAFTEGGRAFPGSGIYRKTQLGVLTAS